MSKLSQDFAITRIRTSRKEGPGFVVRISHRGKTVQKEFPDQALGGERKALKAARAFRDSILKKSSSINQKSSSQKKRRTRRSDDSVGARMLGFRVEHYGLFVDDVNTEKPILSVSSRSGDILINYPTPSGGVMAGALSPHSFTRFNLGNDSETLTLSLIYSESKELVIGSAPPERRGAMIEWQVKATAMIEAFKFKGSKTIDINIRDVLNKVYSGYVAGRVNPWIEHHLNEKSIVCRFEGKKLTLPTLEYINGIGGRYAQALVSFNISTIPELASSSPAEIHAKAIRLRQKDDHLILFKAPSLFEATSWVVEAQVINMCCLCSSMGVSRAAGNDVQT